MNKIGGILLALFLTFSPGGCTAPLMQAVEKNDLVGVKGLLDKGANIEARSESRNGIRIWERFPANARL